MTNPRDNYGPSLDEMWAPAYRTTPANSPTSSPAPAAPQPAKPGVSMPIVAAIVAAALIGGVSGAGVGIWAVSTHQPAASPGFIAPPTITVNDSENASLVTAIAATAGPSVVTIHVSAGGASGTGSGVFLTSDGYLVTNAHVVSIDGATGTPTIRVSTGDGRLFNGELIGADPLSDLAVVKVEADTPFTPVEFGDSSQLNVGDLTVAIGAPLGLSNTVTNGIVSALHRSITVPSSAAPDDGDTPENVPESPFDFWEFNGPGVQQLPRSSALIYLPVIQTDASINPGNSGGALLDSSGKLIGINVAIAGTGSSSTTGSIGLGFAIPSNLVKRITSELIETGTATHGLLGVTVMDTTSDEAIADKQILGASVQSVTPGGAAGAAGVREGDIITGFNGLPITGSIDLTAQVRAAAPGSQATVTFVRSGEPRTVNVTLGELS